MYEIPQCILIDDKQFSIREKGDFRMVLDCFNALGDIELSTKEKIVACLMIFYEDCNAFADLEIFPDLEKAINEMYKFFNCGQEDAVGATTGYKLIDWHKDEQLICSAINKVAGKEIRLEGYMHWWTFMGYYMNVGESPLSTVVSIRHKIVKNKKLEKHEREFRANNPQYFDWDYQTLEQKEATKEVMQLWNSKKK